MLRQVIQWNKKKKKRRYPTRDPLLANSTNGNAGSAFSGLLTDGVGVGGKKAPFPKICNTYALMTRLGTLIPYLKKV